MAEERKEKKETAKSEDKVFKKQYVDRLGHIQEFETRIAPKTVNDELTENITQTKEDWKKQSTRIITSNFKKKLEKSLGKYFKYIRKDKAGKLQARNGGVLSKIDDNYIMLLNTRTRLAWSVQYKDIVSMYEIPKENIKNKPDSKKIAQQEKEKLKELKKTGK